MRPKTLVSTVGAVFVTAANRWAGEPARRVDLVRQVEEAELPAAAPGVSDRVADPLRGHRRRVGVHARPPPRQQDRGQARTYTALLAANLVLNARWTWLFFTRRQLGTSAVAAAALTASSADLTRRAIAARGPSGGAPRAVSGVVCVRDAAVDPHLATQSRRLSTPRRPRWQPLRSSQTKTKKTKDERRTVSASPTACSRFLEDAVYWAIAVVLVVGSVALLVAQFNTMLRLRNTPASRSSCSRS